MRTQNRPVCHEGGACSTARRGAANEPAYKNIENLCAAYTEGVHSIFKARPPKRSSWDKERAKRILSLCLHEFEEAPVNSGVKDDK